MALKLFLSRWIRGIKRSSSTNLFTNIYNSALNNLHRTLTFTVLWNACQYPCQIHALARGELRAAAQRKWRTKKQSCTHSEKRCLHVLIDLQRQICSLQPTLSSLPRAPQWDTNFSILCGWGTFFYSLQWSLETALKSNFPIMQKVGQSWTGCTRTIIGYKASLGVVIRRLKFCITTVRLNEDFLGYVYCLVNS